MDVLYAGMSLPYGVIFCTHTFAEFCNEYFYFYTTHEMCTFLCIYTCTFVLHID